MKVLSFVVYLNHNEISIKEIKRLLTSFKRDFLSANCYLLLVC